MDLEHPSEPFQAKIQADLKNTKGKNKVESCDFNTFLSLLIHLERNTFLTFMLFFVVFFQV